MGFDVGGIKLTASGGALSLDAANQWMAVNASGILTRPQTPYMRGQLSGQANVYSGGGGPMLVTADVNRGNCWNNGTGYFTCPVTGYYMTTGAGIANTQAGYFYINRNGGGYHFTHWNHTASWHYVSLSSIVLCNAGDTLSWSISGTTPSTGVGFYGPGGHGMYSIALMV